MEEDLISISSRRVQLRIVTFIYGNLPLHIEFVKFTWPGFESRAHVCQLFGVSWWCARSLLCFHAFFCFLNESHFQIYIYLQTTCQDLNVCVLLSAPAASHSNSFPGRAGGQVWLTLRAFYLLWAGRKNLIISSYKSNFSCSPFTRRAHSESSTDPPHMI